MSTEEPTTEEFGDSEPDDAVDAEDETTEEEPTEEA